MTLYRHYGDKDGVIVAALEQWSAESIGWLADQVDRCGGDPPPAVAARLHLLVEGAEAAAIAGQPATAGDLLALADAVAC